MNEQLTIENFGPIRNVTVHFGKFTILVGQQATGKTTIAKLLSICRYFSYIVGAGGLDDKSSFAQGIANFGLSEFVQANSYIHYKGPWYEIEVKKANTPIVTDFQQKIIWMSDAFSAVMEERQKWLAARHNGPSVLPPSFFADYVGQLLDNPFYFPAERSLQSLFSLGKEGVQNMNDALFNQLSKIADLNRHFTSEVHFEPLDVTYKFDGTRGLIRTSEQSAYTSLATAASGFQSAVPICLAVEYYGKVRSKAKTFIIEEPELSLFPASQATVVAYLVESLNIYGHNFVVNTHSPYVLSALNNALYAYQVAQASHHGHAQVIRDRNRQLSPADVSAYMLHSNGLGEDMMDKDEQLIRTELIDEVSQVLNKEFNTLLDLEYHA